MIIGYSRPYKEALMKRHNLFSMCTKWCTYLYENNMRGRTSVKYLITYDHDDFKARLERGNGKSLPDIGYYDRVVR